MKKAIVYLFCAAFLSVVFLSSCKKYEEGPGISFVSKKKRISGDWTFEKVTVADDGVTEDATDLYTGARFEIKEDGTGTFSEGGDVERFTWEFANDKESFRFNIDGDVYTWDILKLKSKELWFRYEDDGTVLEFHLKQ